MNRKLHSVPLLLLVLLLGSPCHAVAQENAGRYPAYPLIACNPYFSFWSFSDHPGKDWTRHWTGSTMGMACLAKIDGKNYRLLGLAMDDSIEGMPLKKSCLLPTRTIYDFEAGGCRIEMTFLNPLLPWDLVQLSKAMGYISWKIEPLDGKAHEVSVYYDCSAEAVVNIPSQHVSWSRTKAEGLDVLSMGSTEQALLQKAGDNLRIDWGYMYLACPKEQKSESAMGGADMVRRAFVSHGVLPGEDDLRMPRSASDEWPVLAWELKFGRISFPVEQHIILAYDEGFSIEFLNRKLMPYWKSKGETTAVMLSNAEKSYKTLGTVCEKFDSELISDLLKCGGQDYSELAVLAFRQSLAAQVLTADVDGTPYLFPKENFSNGCISTVDVIYPASPELLFFNPDLLKANLEPIFRYISTGRWKFPFAPHDLGTYPLANGQVYGGGEKTEEDQMPVEETGNMLLMMYAIATADGNASFAESHFPTLTTWAGYLRQKGFDPGKQLCTDDFAGHLAHNTNISIKAILAMEAYSRLCDMTGRKKEAADFHSLCQQLASEWKKEAADGSHYRLSFDKAGSWSQKYNLVWDKVLNMNLFDKEIARTETSWYLSRQNKFGLPLDNRADYTKADWIIWTATLADKSGDFQSFTKPMVDFLASSPDRVPFSDWYDTRTARKVGFQARSVIGGVFMKMLSDSEIWKKWRTYK